ncbi:hypothetical protein QAD02_005183, partial [Eretmocerus hayati]
DIFSIMTRTGFTTIILFVIIAGAVALENYMDYGNESPNKDKAALDSRIIDILFGRDSDGYTNLNSQYLQPRVAERSSGKMRIRYGRSYPKQARAPLLLRYGRSYPNS